jgi:beta-glucosidase
LRTYRFSISWPRVIPDGTGAVNAKGLDFYERLVDQLLAAGIVPNATLNHWDLPQALQDRGGWPNRESADWFAGYARVLFDRLGDRVPLWATHNEPWVVAMAGYASGDMAPGLADHARAHAAAHHLLLAHGKAVQAFRAGTYRGEIGMVLNLSQWLPATDNEADRAACQRAIESTNQLFCEPLFNARYPATLLDWLGPMAPPVRDGDMKVISQPIDWLGVNYYMTWRVRHNHAGGPFKWTWEPVSAPNWGLTDMGWGINPIGLKAVLLEMKDAYGNPKLFVTENGCAVTEVPDGEGYVDDEGRVNFLRAHFAAAHEAMTVGVNLQGYYVWSLMDNFEWHHGYSKRFGLVRVNYDTGRRIPKRSAAWYREVIQRNGVDA